MTYVREVTKLTCIVIIVFISSLAQFAYFLSLFELVSLVSKAPVTLKDRTTFLKLDKRSENGTKCREKNTIFKFVQRPCYAPARMSLGLTRPAMFYPELDHERTMSFAFFLRPFRSHFALTAHLPRSHRAL